MARKRAKYFQGSRCKGNCSGHQAGADYVANGGTMYSRTSPSFNNGMRIAQGLKPISARKQAGLKITYRRK